MAKIKDWAEIHQGQDTGVVYKTYGLAYETTDQTFTKNMHRDIAAYCLELEMKVKPEPKPKGAQYKKPDPKKAAAHARDWGYDEMVDNRLTLNI